MTEKRIRDLALREVLEFSERDALAVAFDELSSGWPIVVNVRGQYRLLHPTDAIGHSGTRRLIDLPLVPARPVTQDMLLDDALETTRDADFLLVRRDNGALGIVGRGALLEAWLESLHARERDTAASPLDQLGGVLDHLPEGIVLLDAENRIRYANPAGRLLLGILARARVGDCLVALADVPLPNLIADAQTGVPRDVQVSEPTQHIVTVRALRPAAGTESQMMLILRDVTHVRHRQAREAIQNRMAMIGQLASGISHDFNNMLTVVSACASMIETDGQASPSAREYGAMISHAAERAASLVRQLLAFSRPGQAQTATLDLGKVLRELGSLAVRLAGKRVRLRVDLDPDLWAVAADQIQIERVVANLVVNARDAMPEGGTLTIEARNVPDWVWSGTAGTGDVRAVRISVIDTGCGMDPETAARAFDPHFTTKGEGGTGLGLAIVRNTVTQLGGAITVATEVGKGTRFDIHLPASRSDDGASVVHRDSVASSQYTGSGSVLIVEDDEEVAEALTRVLKHAGYAVTSAGTLDEALTFTESSGEPDLVITAFVLSTGSGISLIRRLEKRFPQLPVLVIGDCLDEACEGRDQRADTTAWLSKPFSGPELLERVAALIGAPDE